MRAFAGTAAVVTLVAWLAGLDLLDALLVGVVATYSVLVLYGRLSGEHSDRHPDGPNSRGGWGL
jgi:hypothetical protein